MDVSGDGTIVTIGSTFNDGNKDKVGSIFVYEFDIINNHWVQRADLDGESEFFWVTMYQCRRMGQLSVLTDGTPSNYRS